jgi:hypothetical protein
MDLTEIDWGGGGCSGFTGVRLGTVVNAVMDFRFLTPCSKLVTVRVSSKTGVIFDRFEPKLNFPFPFCCRFQMITKINQDPSIVFKGETFGLTGKTFPLGLYVYFYFILFLKAIIIRSITREGCKKVSTS